MVVLISLVLVVAQEDQAEADQDQDYLQGQPLLSKHNYGYTLTKTNRVGLKTAEVRMIFNFEIPQAYEINCPPAPLKSSDMLALYKLEYYYYYYYMGYRMVT